MQPCELRRISEGNYSGEFFIEVKNENNARELELKAPFYGFRTKLERKDNGFLLTIFGDSQEKVDDFINLVLSNGLELLRLLAGTPERLH